MGGITRLALPIYHLIDLPFFVVSSAQPLNLGLQPDMQNIAKTPAIDTGFGA
jgi:hypothetical protein